MVRPADANVANLNIVPLNNLFESYAQVSFFVETYKGNSPWAMLSLMQLYQGIYTMINEYTAHPDWDTMLDPLCAEFQERAGWQDLPPPSMWGRENKIMATIAHHVMSRGGNYGPEANDFYERLVRMFAQGSNLHCITTFPGPSACTMLLGAGDWRSLIQVVASESLSIAVREMAGVTGRNFSLGWNNF